MKMALTQKIGKTNGSLEMPESSTISRPVLFCFVLKPASNLCMEEVG
jgi:hypothetical protein